jgi:hypothetical protein
MTTHKFKIGATVFVDADHNRNYPPGAYIITQRMPEHEGEFEYRVWSRDEQHERFVRESHLRAVPTAKAKS